MSGTIVCHLIRYICRLLMLLRGHLHLLYFSFMVLYLWFYAYVLRPPVSVSIPRSACASVYCYFVLFLLLLYDTVCEVYK